MLTVSSTGEDVLSALCWLFSEKNQGLASKMVSILQDSACDHTASGHGPLGLDFRHYLTFFVPPRYLDVAKSDWFSEQINAAFPSFLYDENLLSLFIDVKVLEPQELPPGLNNCHFKVERTILHDGLRFRSRAEIAIYDELKTRDVLFFPNAAAVFGSSATEYGASVEKREPDFLICFRGKWGILEINGDEYHSGLLRTTEDHKRARRFNHHGLYFVQAFPADKCYRDAVSVVDEFLMLLEKHK